MSPEQKAVARELFPTFYRERIRTADKAIELQRRLVHQKIEGIKTKEDLLFQYAVEAGLIDSEAVENILHPERAEKAKRALYAQIRYQRGLFNPRRLIRGDFGTGAREYNAAELLGKQPDPAVMGTTSLYGTGNYGFSAVEGLTSFEGTDEQVAAGEGTQWEGFTNFEQMMKSMTPYLK